MKIKQYISFQTKCIYTSKTNFVIYWIQLRENKILEIMIDYTPNITVLANLEVC